GIGQIAGPLIAIAGNILGGMFDKPPEPPTMRATGGLNFVNGRWKADGGSYGGAPSVVRMLGDVGKSLQALLGAAGVSSTSSPHGLTYQTYQKGDFSSATTFI